MSCRLSVDQPFPRVSLTTSTLVKRGRRPSSLLFALRWTDGRAIRNRLRRRAYPPPLPDCLSPDRRFLSLGATVVRRLHGIGLSGLWVSRSHGIIWRILFQGSAEHSVVV